jgi:hypothetical protein
MFRFCSGMVGAMRPADTLAPPLDFNVLAARAALDTYSAALAQGCNAGAAWQEAVEVFALHHPSWPLPLAEREAARAAGAMLMLDGREMPGETPEPSGKPPNALLNALASPAQPVPPFKDGGHRSIGCRMPWWALSVQPPLGLYGRGISHSGRSGAAQ